MISLSGIAAKWRRGISFTRVNIVYFARASFNILAILAGLYHSRRNDLSQPWRNSTVCWNTFANWLLR